MLALHRFKRRLSYLADHTPPAPCHSTSGRSAPAARGWKGRHTVLTTLQRRHIAAAFFLPTTTTTPLHCRVSTHLLSEGSGNSRSDHTGERGSQCHFVRFTRLLMLLLLQ